MNTSIAVTGGSGSFAAAVLPLLLERYDRVALLSRNWIKQRELRSQIDSPKIRWFIADVRDLPRLKRAFDGVDMVLHAAALKDVVSCEYNPREAFATNTVGSQNVVDAAIDCGVRRCVLISTDKAVAATTTYGKSKALAESLFVQGNAYAHQTRFSVVRYGNCLGSSGSVVSLWRDQSRSGEITLTDERMTRFWMTLDQAVHFVLDCTDVAYGGEIFIPKLKACFLSELARVIAPDASVRVTGLRPGEKLHELLVSEEESGHTLDCGDSFVVLPEFREWGGEIAYEGAVMARGAYSSLLAEKIPPEGLAEMLEGS